MTAGVAGGLSSGINTAVNGGDFGDIAQSFGTGFATGFVSGYVGGSLITSVNPTTQVGSGLFQTAGSWGGTSVTFAEAALAGAATGFTSGSVSTALAGGSFEDSFKNGLKSGAVGSLSAATMHVGGEFISDHASLASTAETINTGGHLSKTLDGGISGAYSAAVFGGDWEDAVVNGAASALANSFAMSVAGSIKKQDQSLQSPEKQSVQGPAPISNGPEPQAAGAEPQTAGAGPQTAGAGPQTAGAGPQPVGPELPVSTQEAGTIIMMGSRQGDPEVTYSDQPNGLSSASLDENHNVRMGPKPTVADGFDVKKTTTRATQDVFNKKYGRKGAAGYETQFNKVPIPGTEIHFKMTKGANYFPGRVSTPVGGGAEFAANMMNALTYMEQGVHVNFFEYIGSIVGLVPFAVFEGRARAMEYSAQKRRLQYHDAQELNGLNYLLSEDEKSYIDNLGRPPGYNKDFTPKYPEFDPKRRPGFNSSASDKTRSHIYNVMRELNDRE